MKAENTIQCPKCKHDFLIEVALTSQLRGKIDAELRVNYDARLARERENLTRDLTQVAQAEAARHNAAKLAELETAAAEREAALQRIQAQLDTTRREATQRAHDEFVAERKAMEEELARQGAALADLRKHEIELRREKIRIEAAQQELEVQNARCLDAERMRLRDELTRTLEAERARARQELASAYAEAQRLREAEHAQQNDALRRQVEDLRRKLETGGEQRRGEACEVCLEEALRTAFPADTIEPVARGVNGADVRQHVCPPGQPPCATILYESKHTAKWSPGWTTKLRDDQRAEQADVAVLVTAALPKEVTTFALVDGVWVTNLACLPSLALALRLGLLQVASHRQAAVGRGQKTELVYAYLTGDTFRRHVESLVTIYTDMGADLAKEKRALTTMWHRREKQLERVTASITGLYADVQAIAGAGALPPLAPLELAGLLEEGSGNTIGNEPFRRAILG